MVAVDGVWGLLGGTTAMLAAAVNGSKVTILDYRGSQPVQAWAWNGTVFVKSVGGYPTTLISASGAITIASGYDVITAGSAAALTLAAPTAAQAGTELIITSRTAFAHTITATGLFNTGAAAVNLATFAAFAGAGVRLVADNLKWKVISSVGVTFS